MGEYGEDIDRNARAHVRVFGDYAVRLPYVMFYLVCFRGSVFRRGRQAGTRRRVPPQLPRRPMPQPQRYDGNSNSISTADTLPDSKLDAAVDTADAASNQHLWLRTD